MEQGWSGAGHVESSAFQKNPGTASGMLQDPFPKGQNRRCPGFCGIMEKGAVGIQGQGLGGESMRFVGSRKQGRSSRIQRRGGGSGKSGKSWECFPLVGHWDGAGGRGQIYSKHWKRWEFLLKTFGKNNQNPGTTPVIVEFWDGTSKSIL